MKIIILSALAILFTTAITTITLWEDTQKKQRKKLDLEDIISGSKDKFNALASAISNLAASKEKYTTLKMNLAQENIANKKKRVRDKQNFNQ